MGGITLRELDAKQITETVAQMCKEAAYYLPDDVGEEKNLIRQNSQKADELRKLAMKARTESEYFKAFSEIL